jgi:FAD:protein FMN transferase
MTVTAMAERTSSPCTPAAGLRLRYATTQWTSGGTRIALAVADADRMPATRAECEQVLSRLDRACNPARADSDLARANRDPGVWVKVDPLLIRALTAAARVARATDGLVDPDGWGTVGIDPDGAIQVTPGTRLDLGPIGPAFAVDVIAGTVPELTGASLIVSVGRHIAVGRPAGEPVHRWTVAVAERDPNGERARERGPNRARFHRGDPLRDTEGLRDIDRPGAEIVVLEEGAVATSSTRTGRHHRGASGYHLLDSGKGSQLDPIWRSASVCAATCVDAGAAGLAAIALGEQAPAWLWERDLAARLVAVDGRVLRVAGWPER